MCSFHGTNSFLTDLISHQEIKTFLLPDHQSNAVYFILIWQPPTFPYRLQYSIIGRLGLNHRVRDGNGCFP